MGHAESDAGKGPAATDHPPRKIGKVDLVPAAGEPAAAKAARGLPGFKEACGLLAAALTGEAAAVFLEWNGQACDVHWRTAAGWETRDPLAKDAAAAPLAVFKALAAPLAEAGQGLVTGQFVVAEKSRRACRLTVRKADKREQLLLQFQDELPAEAGIVERLGGMVSGFLPVGRRKAATDAASASGPAPPRVELQPQGKRDVTADAAGLGAATAVLGRALAGRACCVRLESTGRQVSVRVDVDGVWRPFDPLDRESGNAAIAAFRTVAGLAVDPARSRQEGKCVTVVEGRPWPCSVVAIRAQGGERIDLHFDYGRPVLKTLADTGMEETLRGQVQSLTSLAQGVFVVAAPRRNGLSTLFEQVMLTTDRLMRDFVSIEDAAAPQREIQNVKASRWDAAAKIAPVDAVDKALREYPQGLISCDLTDADLARKLVTQAEQGQFVVMGIVAGDAAEAIAAVLKLGVPAEQFGRFLVGGVCGRLVRKLCPRCREEYLPPLDELATVRLDPTAAATLWRAAAEGCEICGGTGYLGRTGIFEVASGRTLQHYVAKAADAGTLRKAAVKDGMVPLTTAGIDLVKAGVTSLDELRRVLAAAPTKAAADGQPAG